MTAAGAGIGCEVGIDTADHGGGSGLPGFLELAEGEVGIHWNEDITSFRISNWLSIVIIHGTVIIIP